MQVTHIQDSTVEELLALTYADYEYITAQQMAALSKDKMYAIHIDWLRPSALAGLTADNITGITDDRYFSEWISPEQMALINPAAIAALTDQKYLAIKLASMNALTKAQLHARDVAKGWNAISTEVDRFKKLLGGNWENTQPLNDPDFMIWFKKLPLQVIEAIITERNGASGFGLNFSYQKLLSTNQISDSTGFSNASLSKNSLTAIFKTIASESTQADISQFNVATITVLINAMGNIEGDWVGIGDDGRWIWRLTEAQVSAVSKQYPAHGASLYRLWIGPAGYENCYLNDPTFIKQFQALSSLSIDELLSGIQFGQTPFGLTLPYQKLLTVEQIKNLSVKTLETLRANPLPDHDKLGEAAPVLLWAHGEKSGPLSRLATDVLRALTVADAQLLNEMHMAILSELDLIYQIPTAALEGLSAAAVAGVSAAQFNDITFSADQVKLLNLTQVKSETFAAVNAAFVSKLSRSQFASLTTDQLKSLSEEAVSGVTVEQVNARYLASFEGRILQKDSKHIIMHLDELVGKLRDTLIFKMVARYLNTLFPSDSRLTVTPLAIPELSIKDVVAASSEQLKAWASNLTNDLRLIDSLNRFTSKDAAKLRGTQVQALNGLMQYLPVQALSGLTSIVVGVLSTAQLSTFSNEQVQQLNVSQLSGGTLIAMGGDFINTLTASQVQSLSQSTVTQLLASDTGVVAELSPRFFQALSDSVLVNAIVSNPIHIQPILRQLSPTQIAALSPSAINGLITSQLFTARMMLDIGHSAVWTFDQFHAMTAIPGALSLIDPNALANALSVDALLSLSTTEISQLTANQYQALLNNLTLSKVIFNAGMGAGYWTVSQLHALAPNTVAYMTQDQYLSYANPLGLALFTSAQQAGMSTNVGLLEIFVTGQVNFWDQATMARIISTIPGMIPLSGLPGGGCGPSKATNVHSGFREDYINMSVTNLQLLFSESLPSIRSSDIGSLELNQNLGDVLRGLTRDNLVRLFNTRNDLISDPIYRRLTENLNFVAAISYFDRNGLQTVLNQLDPTEIMSDRVARALVANPMFKECLRSLNYQQVQSLLDCDNLVRTLNNECALEIVENQEFNKILLTGKATLVRIFESPSLMEALTIENLRYLEVNPNYRDLLSNSLSENGLLNILRSDLILQRYFPIGLVVDYAFFKSVLQKLTPEELARVIGIAWMPKVAVVAQHFFSCVSLQTAIGLLDVAGLANVLANSEFIAHAASLRSMIANGNFNQAMAILEKDGLANVFNSDEAFAAANTNALTTNPNLILAINQFTVVGLVNLMNNFTEVPTAQVNNVARALVMSKNFNAAIPSLNFAGLRNVIRTPNLLNSVGANDLANQVNFNDVLRNVIGEEMVNIVNNDRLMVNPTIVTAVVGNPIAFALSLRLLSTDGLRRVLTTAELRHLVVDGWPITGGRMLTNPNLGALFDSVTIEDQNWVVDVMFKDVDLAASVSKNNGGITLAMLQALQNRHPDTFQNLLPNSFTAPTMAALSSSPAGLFFLNQIPTDLVKKIGGNTPLERKQFYSVMPQGVITGLVNGAAQFLNSTDVNESIGMLLGRDNGLGGLTLGGLNQLLTFGPLAGTFINAIPLRVVKVIYSIPMATLAGLNPEQANLLVNDFWARVDRMQLSAMMTSPTLGANYFAQPDVEGQIREQSLRRIPTDVLVATYQNTVVSRPIIRDHWWGHLSAAQKTALNAIPGFDPIDDGDLLVFEDNPTLPNKQNALVESVINTPVHNPSDVQLDLLKQKMAVFNASSSSTGGFTQAAQVGSELMTPPLRFASSAAQ